MDWIRKFTSLANEVVKGSGITLELIYVGKKHIETIANENLSRFWDVLKVRQFRARLFNIWYSKLLLCKTISNDTKLKHLRMLLGFDCSCQGWIIGQGSKDLIVVNENIVLKSLHQLKESGITFTNQNFLSELEKVIETVERTVIVGRKQCRHHIVIPGTNGMNQENVVCVDCNHPMEKYVVFKCCTE